MFSKIKKTQLNIDVTVKFYILNDIWYFQLTRDCGSTHLFDRYTFLRKEMDGFRTSTIGEDCVKFTGIVLQFVIFLSMSLSVAFVTLT